MRILHTHTTLTIKWGKKAANNALGGASTYTVQNGSDMAAGVDGGMFAAELDHFSKEADGLGCEGLEIGLGDAGGCFGHGGFGLFSGVRVGDGSGEWGWLSRDAHRVCT